MAGQSLTTAIHRTQAAQERINDLQCYKCDTMEDGEACVDVVNSNNTNFLHKCVGEEFICMVRLYNLQYVCLLYLLKEILLLKGQTFFIYHQY